MENDFIIQVGDKTIETIEQLKELPTRILVMIKDDLCKEKLKCEKAYKMCSVNIVLGAGLVTLGLVSGAFFSSLVGGYLIGKGIFRTSDSQNQIKVYDQIVNTISDEISYREFGKEVFPEFYQKENKYGFDIEDLFQIK